MKRPLDSRVEDILFFPGIFFMVIFCVAIFIYFLQDYTKKFLSIKREVQKTSLS